MKMRPALLSLACLALTASAAGQTSLYNNGGPNGNVDAWAINSGFVTSDTFTLQAQGDVDGVGFWAWLVPGDVVNSVDVSFTSAENGGTSFFNQILSPTQTNCAVNQYGYDVCLEGLTIFPVVQLNSGTYWLNLSNATTGNGDEVYWDEDSGPSQASINTLGTIPSESFNIVGYGTTSSQTLPEPGSILLFGSGIVAAVGLMRRWLP
ncbi:MAG TPA: PEP-CTERM sorting domain-containing protein [Terriglobales bacterium]|nr:PEP-CTERM sorting domain-containing protein [Terriglobales bacterium]